MADLIELRSSSLPLAFRCAGSVRRPDLPVREDHEAATMGTAVHDALRPLVERGSVDWDGLPDVAKAHGVDFAEMRMLVAVGSKLWHQVSESFPEAMTEVELAAEIVPGVLLTGHVDVLSITDTVAREADWKTGRKDSDYEHQMRAYGVLTLLDNPELTEVTDTVLWLRDGEIENYTTTRSDADAWILRLLQEVVQWNGTYRPGSHCQYCPRSHECEAANAMVRRDVAAINDSALVARAECDLGLMKPAEVVSLYEKATLVESYAGRVRDAIKAHVLAHGAIVANGISLQIEAEPRRELDAVKAWPVLEAVGFEDQDFAASMTLGISKVEKRIAEKAGKGKGAGAVRALKEALEAVGAIGVKEIQKLRAKRI